MGTMQIPENTKRIISITFVLIFISTMIIVIMGFSIKSINKDIQKLNHFLSNSQDIHANFEESLRMYTERTKTITDYLSTLRPDNKEEYIKFISDIEDLAQNLRININLQSLEPEEKTLNYYISFEGDLNLMKRFLLELEKMPYFIQVVDLDYVTPMLYVSQKEGRNGNIQLKIKLYIK